jgi:hypothetical protein
MRVASSTIPLLRRAEQVDVARGVTRRRKALFDLHIDRVKGGGISPGFPNTGIVLTPDQLATVNETLALGSVTQTVEVTANAEMLQTGTAALGQAVTSTAMVELPLNGRNPGALVFLSAGTFDVSVSRAGENEGYVSNPNDTGASANGARQASTFYLLDGANNMDPGNLLAHP